jgi:hypothetical protein
MPPNEVLARAVLSLISAPNGPLLERGAAGEINWDAIEEFEAYASSGERALLNLFWAAWRCEGIAEVFARCDVATSRTVFGVLITAYADQLGVQVTIASSARTTAP